MLSGRETEALAALAWLTFGFHLAAYGSREPAGQTRKPAVMLNNRLFFNDFGVECTDNLSIRGFGLFRVRLRALWWMDSSLYPKREHILGCCPFDPVHPCRIRLLN